MFEGSAPLHRIAAGISLDRRSFAHVLSFHRTLETTVYPNW